MAAMVFACNTGLRSDFLDKLELQTLDARSAQLPGDENTFYLINFWATWCKPCIREIPALLELEKNLAGEGLKLIFISNEDGKKVESFINNRELGISSFLMPSAIETYELLYLPTTYLISPDGQILLKQEGEQAWDEPVMIDKIRRLISE
jgi:thiol-disulfide isomerase/thioredoxin